MEDKDLGYILNLRKVVGTRPIIMSGAAVMIVNKDGEILLERRRDNGLWDYPAGSMELGESFEECARREALEETGLVCGRLEFFTTDSGKDTFNIYPNGDQTYFAGVIYLCRDYSGTLRPQEEEVLDLKFFGPDEIPEDMTPLNIGYLKRAFEYLRQQG